MRSFSSRTVAIVLAGLSFLSLAVSAPGAHAAKKADDFVKFVADGDRICKEAALRLEGLVGKYETVKISGFRQKKGHRAVPAQAIAFMTEVAIPETYKTLGALRALPPPAAETRAYKDLLAALQADLDGLTKGKIDVVAGDVMADSSKKFKAFGFTQCGSSGRPGDSSATKK